MITNADMQPAWMVSPQLQISFGRLLWALPGTCLDRVWAFAMGITGNFL